MPDIISQTERKARKQHTCDYCNGIIAKGEVYKYQKLVDGSELYEWKSHLDCSFVASELWHYMDCDEGVTQEDFDDMCRDFCDTFICPICDTLTDDCYYCLDKIVAMLKKYELKRVRSEEKNVWERIFKLFERKERLE